MELAHAKAIAHQIVEVITPHCALVDIAGSIRRQKPWVKDIEILCLLPNPNKMFMALQPFILKVQKGKASGRYMQLWLKQGIMLDLFIPSPPDYYRQLAIRTGSSTFSNSVIATTWVKKGWRGTADGLRLSKECKKIGKKWECTISNPTLPPEWASEKEFFNWLGIEYIEPEFRH